MTVDEAKPARWPVYLVGGVAGLFVLVVALTVLAGGDNAPPEPSSPSLTQTAADDMGLALRRMTSASPNLRGAAWVHTVTVGDTSYYLLSGAPFDQSFKAAVVGGRLSELEYSGPADGAALALLAAGAGSAHPAKTAEAIVSMLSEATLARREKWHFDSGVRYSGAPLPHFVGGGYEVAATIARPAD